MERIKENCYFAHYDFGNAKELGFENWWKNKHKI